MKTISQVSELLSGGTPKKSATECWGGNIPWFSAINLNERFLHTSTITLSDYGLRIASNLAPKGSTLLLVRGSGLFNRIPISFAESSVAFNQDIKAFVPNEDADPLFFHYWLRSLEPILKENIELTGIGAGKFDTEFLRNLPFPEFSIEEQRQRGHLASLLDRKIENNQKIAATLEEMARALYRSWFVDFDPVHAKAAGEQPAYMDEGTTALFPDRFGANGLPVGWGYGSLSDLANNPKTGVKPNEIDASTPYIGLEHMPRGSIRLSRWSTAEGINSQKYKINHGDLLFGKLRPYFHKVGLSAIDGVCSTDIVVIRPVKQEWRSFVLSLISSSDFVAYTNAASSGTRMPRTSWNAMKEYKVALPPLPIAAAFESLIEVIWERILADIHTAHKMADLRDTLLPKLMSGEIHVGEAREQVEELT
mgnify:CR=1 FL=1